VFGILWALKAYFYFRLRMAALSACPPCPSAAPAVTTAASSNIIITNGFSGERLSAQVYSSVRGLLGPDTAAAANAAINAGAFPPTFIRLPSVLWLLSSRPFGHLVIAPIWGVMVEAINAFVGVGCPLAERQMRLGSLVNFLFPGANPLWGFGV
ncbi:hypothetical protein V8C42DRAFT_338311, partial [Trichoderma barbatum]